MRRSKKISTRARQENVIARMLSEVPEEARTAVMLKAVQCMGGSLHVTATVPCPVCGQKTLEAQFHHGVKRCRNCCYYNQQSFSPERIAETIADSLAWWTSHRVCV